jgi:hypothetical protein
VPAAAAMCCCALIYEGTMFPRTLKLCVAGKSCSSRVAANVILAHLVEMTSAGACGAVPTALCDLLRHH